MTTRISRGRKLLSSRAFCVTRNRKSKQFRLIPNIQLKIFFANWRNHPLISNFAHHDDNGTASKLQLSSPQPSFRWRHGHVGSHDPCRRRNVRSSWPLPTPHCTNPHHHPLPIWSTRHLRPHPYGAQPYVSRHPNKLRYRLGQATYVCPTDRIQFNPVL